MSQEEKIRKIALNAMVAVKDDILRIIREEVEVIVRHEIEQFKYSRTSREEWCCNNMRKFAARVWHINAPTQINEGFTVGYAYQDMPVIYCPFCGAKL